MLNEEKIKLMTGIAMYEKKAEKDIFPINRYFKGDYIGAHMLRSFVSYTFSCLLIFLLWFLYSIEDILDTLDLEALADTAKHMGVYYLLGLHYLPCLLRAVRHRRQKHESISGKAAPPGKTV